MRDLAKWHSVSKQIWHSVSLFLFAALATGTLAASPARAHIDPTFVRRVMREATPRVVACRAEHRLAEGRYVARVVVGSSGSVASVTMTSAPAPLTDAAERCLVAAFMAVRFPPSPRGEITIVWPFVLASAEPATPPRP